MSSAGTPGAQLPASAHVEIEHVPANPDPPKARLSLGQRVLEILPGLATWTVILGLLALPTLGYPSVVVVMIIVLDIYWFGRSVIVTQGIRKTHKDLKREMAIEWHKRCLELPASSWTDPDGTEYDPREIYHAALIPTYTEKYEVLQATLKAWDDAAYPGDRKIVAIIPRTTDTDGIENVRRLQQEFA